MTPDEAHQQTADAEAKQAETEQASQKASAQAQVAKQAAAQAQATADANPTPENMNALAQANQNAAAAAEDAAKAAKERTDALTKANDARLAEVQAIVKATNEKIAQTQSNPNGLQFKTDYGFHQFTPKDYARIIYNNMSVRVTGVERKVVLGASGTFLLGAKNEAVLACKNNLIVGFELKTVVGASKTNYLGLKMDTIGGFKVDKLNGPKREVHVGPKVYLGPDDKTVQPEKVTLAGIRKALSDRWQDFRKKDQNKAASRSLRASKLLADIQTMRGKFAALKEKVDTAQQNIKDMIWKSSTIQIHCSGNLAYEAKGTTTIDGGGAKFVLDASAELSKGGSVKCDGGGTSVNGKVLIN